MENRGVMMIIIDEWMMSLSDKLKTTFGKRLLFLGLQGSYQRDEARTDSDIDIVIILDVLTMEDLECYKSIISTLPHNDKACGFISGKKELQEWSKHELFQFSKDTCAYHGDLNKLLPLIKRLDIINGVKIAASNLYHYCCHNYLYGEAEALKEIYKGTFFVLQGAYYLRNNKYIKSKEKLLPLLDGVEKQMLNISANWDVFKDATLSYPYDHYKTLLQWCSGIMTEEFIEHERLSL